MPDPTFALVGDYWMSFVLSSKFHVPLIKLGATSAFLSRTDDSDASNLQTKLCRQQTYANNIGISALVWGTIE
jgi:hypothetical protein